MAADLNGLPPGLGVHQGADELRAFMPSDGALASALPCAAVQPHDTAQIQALIDWAHRRSRKLVPVSSAAGPRRHGGSVPAAGAVVMDLSQMKRVRHVDGPDAIAVIEPGVTFPEFDAQLANHGLRSYKPLLPRRSKSVIASHLEREPITSPRDQWDSCDPLSAAELVFGTGKLFRTGSASIADGLEEQLERGLRQKAGPGPFATDFVRVLMGSQGTLGVISWASVHCERIPALERAFFVPADELAPLAELSSRIGWRKLAAQTFIVNRLQLALLLGHDRGSVLKLAARLPAWTLFVNIAAPPYFPQERIDFETDALQADAAGVGLRAVEQLAGKTAEHITRMHADLPARHYKDRLDCGHDEIFFLSQTDKAEAFVKTFDRLHGGSGSALPCAVYLQPRVQGSSCYLEFTSFWDGAADASPQRTAFHRAASHALADAGAYFSRPYGIWKDIAYARDTQIVPYLRHVKALLDPHAVLNPGKFC